MRKNEKERMRKKECERKKELYLQDSSTETGWIPPPSSGRNQLFNHFKNQSISYKSFNQHRRNNQ